MKRPEVIIIMGVSGCGKTSVAEALAQAWHYQMLDADDYHSRYAKRQMADGIGITDRVRKPWLTRLVAAIEQQCSKQQGVVLACSALRKAYRDKLRSDLPQAQFIHLAISAKTARQRLLARQGHYAKESLLDSQFATLEAPFDELNTICIDAEQPLETVLREIEFTITAK